MFHVLWSESFVETRVNMTARDLPGPRVLTGNASECLPAVMSQFRLRVALEAATNTRRRKLTVAHHVFCLY